MKHEVCISINDSEKTDTEVINWFRAAMKNTPLGSVITIECRTEGNSSWFPEDESRLLGSLVFVDEDMPENLGTHD